MVEAIALGNIETEPRAFENGWVFCFPGGAEPNRLVVLPVLPGISLQYLTFHSTECLTNFRYSGKVLAIDFCCEGRVEWQCSNDTFSYLEEGDIRISTGADCVGSFGFPTGHYHGITITLLPEETAAALQNNSALAELLSLDAEMLWHRVETLGGDLELRKNEAQGRLFRQLSTLDPVADAARLRLNTLEILLQLSQMELREKKQEHRYYPRSFVERIRRARALMVEDPSVHYSLPELALRFDMSETMLKRGFRSVYGNSPYAYLKEYRLQLGAGALRDGSRSISEIALDSGYENPSKFAAAFREKYGVTPKEYRNRSKQAVTRMDSFGAVSD